MLATLAPTVSGLIAAGIILTGARVLFAMRAA
jgi:hypothetical protein